MSLLDYLELEERVGRIWHRFVGERSSWPHFPEAAVSLDSVRNQLSVFFRGIGGDRGITITAGTARRSGHRLSWKQRIGMDEERFPVACRDEVSLSLPDTLDHFSESASNRDLYFWLAAFFTLLEPLERSTDLLRADLLFLMASARATQRVLAAFPGLRERHAGLAATLLAQRPKRSLTEKDEAWVEEIVLTLLGGPPCSADNPYAAVGRGEAPPPEARAPLSYHPFLPVPLWGEALDRPPQARPEVDDPSLSDPDKKPEEKDEEKRRHAERQRKDNADRKDPLILNRFEKVMSIAEMVNVNRGADDPDEQDAKKAADEMDTITIAQHDKKAATKLKFDLDLPPEAADPSRLLGEFLYPEWDYRRTAYHPDHCVVMLRTMDEEGETWIPDQATHRRIRQIKRQFEALRTKAKILRGQLDGSELDTEAVVRARCDFLASGYCSDQVYTQRRPMERDLAVSVLVDASLSTDSWLENRRVLDVEKEALAVFSHALAACGDSFSIQTFTSRKRSQVRVDRLKTFDEPFTPTIIRRIGAVKPGYYTRIGAAIRHSTSELELRPNRHRLLLVITDGKPNDIDHYEGRYGVEDTRKAVQETRSKGIAVFGITIDKKAQAYFPHLFGRGGYAIVHHLAQLTVALPRIYRHIAG